MKYYGHLASVCVLSACASVDRQQSADFDAVRTAVRERTAALLPSSGDDADYEGTIAPEVLELLQQDLTEDSAVKIAVLNNRSVRAALARLNVSSAELVQAGLLRNPVFSANAKFFDAGTELEIGVLQPFIDLFFVSARKRVAESELEATRAEIAGEIVRLVYDVRRAFVRVHAGGRVLDVDREALRAAQASCDLTRELHRAGNVTDARLTTDELALGRAKLAVTRAESDVVEAREPLNLLLGLWGDSIGWTVAGTIGDEMPAPRDLEHVESRAIAASFDLSVGRAHAVAEARRAGFSSWERAFSTGEIGLVAKREAVDGEWGLGPALVFDVPVFDAGGASQAAATARLRAALADHVSLAVEIRSAARRLRERSLALQEQAAFLRSDVLPAAKRLVRETLQNYNAMQIGVFDVFIVKEEEIAAQRAHVETLRDALLAGLDLEELLAGHLNRERVEADAGRPVAWGAAGRAGGH
jgi:cobalt-zinc-cadmium efflux system outer membrane protein